MTVVNDTNQYLPPVVTIPSALTITAITRTFPMVVSTVANSDQSFDYMMQQNVIFTIPYTFGMWQLNNMSGTVTGVSGTDISVNIDARNFDAFSNPNNGQIATLSPNGSKNLQYNNNTANYVPFRSLNNIGN